MTAEVVQHGRCLCGHYHFKASGNPIFVAHCHCESCRRFNGAPTVPYVGYPAGEVVFEPARPPAFASSPEVKRSFCEHCSTPLAYEAKWCPGEIHLFRTNFDRPEHFEATRHVFFDERETDHDIVDDLPRYGSVRGAAIAWGSRPAFRVLFLCTGNSARSILAEGILSLKAARLGERRVRAHSAGSHPTSEVHPEALAALRPHVFRLDRLRSKSWNEFSAPEAPPLDAVITLCDAAADEACPAFTGPVERRHWGLPDPVNGTATFEETWTAIEERVDAYLVELGATPK